MSDGIKNYEPLWDQWYIEKSIGKGSYGEVFKAYRDVDGKREYAAIKYISIPKAGDEAFYRKKYTVEECSKLYDERADKLSIEVSTMLKLRSAKNVVHYEDHMKTRKPGKKIGWDIIIRMELLTGLEDYLSRRGFSAKDVAKLGIDICSAIGSCQEIDVIHRDIKIENIFVDDNGNYKLGDFGVSKVGTGTATGTVTGTEDYMAPEISRDHKYNDTVDIYALGIVLYQLLNNRRKPYIAADIVPGQDAEAQAHLKRITGDEPMPAPKFASAELAEIVLKACAFERHDRYQTPAEMAKELSELLPTLSDSPILMPRGFDEVEDYSEGSSEGSDTISDFGGKSDEGKKTISDIDDPPVLKKKSKLPIILAAILVCLALAGGVTGYLLFSNGPVVAESISGIPDEHGMVVGDTYELAPKVMPKEAYEDVEFITSDENIASVDENGVVTAKAPGEAVVTVKCDDIQVEMKLTVNAKKIEVTGINGNFGDVTLTVGGDGFDVVASVVPEDATVKTLTYESSDSKVVTVDENGKVTPVAAGTATIKVMADGGVTETIKVTVQPVVTKTPTSTGGTKKTGGSTKYNGGSTNNTGGGSNYTGGGNNYTGGGTTNGGGSTGGGGGSGNIGTTNSGISSNQTPFYEDS